MYVLFIPLQYPYSLLHLRIVAILSAPRRSSRVTLGRVAFSESPGPIEQQPGWVPEHVRMSGTGKKILPLTGWEPRSRQQYLILKLHEKTALIGYCMANQWHRSKHPLVHMNAGFVCIKIQGQSIIRRVADCIFVTHFTSHKITPSPVRQSCGDGTLVHVGGGNRCGRDAVMQCALGIP